jgi:hypothetical protein
MLSQAVISGNVQLVRRLISEGESVEFEDQFGLKPLDYARIVNDQRMINIISRTKSPWGVRCLRETDKDIVCSLTQDIVTSGNGVIIFGDSGEYAYKTIDLINWFKEKDTNPATLETILNISDIVARVKTIDFTQM